MTDTGVPVWYHTGTISYTARLAVHLLAVVAHAPLVLKHLLLLLRIRA